MLLPLSWGLSAPALLCEWRSALRAWSMGSVSPLSLSGCRENIRPPSLTRASCSSHPTFPPTIKLETMVCGATPASPYACLEVTHWLAAHTRYLQRSPTYNISKHWVFPDTRCGRSASACVSLRVPVTEERGGQSLCTSKSRSCHLPPALQALPVKFCRAFS